MKIDRFLDAVNTRDKKFHDAIRISVILLFTISLLSGFLTQSLFAFGQNNNQTDSSVEREIIQYIPDDNAKLNNPEDGEMLTSENTPSNSLSDDDNSANNQQDTNDELATSNSNSPVSHPDEDCLFDPSMPKCAPDENGNCPEGFGMNEDGQCFPRGGCPDGYHRVDDDESVRCIPNSDGCPPGMIFRPDMKSCGEKEYVCSQYPELKECKANDGAGSDETRKAAFDSGYSHGCSDAKISIDSQRYLNQPGKGPSYHTSDFMDGYYQGFDYCSTTVNNIPYESGYNHGCSDAKIDDVTKRYINQVGTGPVFHTNEFMRGYYDGFDTCSNNNDSSNTSKGIFKIVVEVTNQTPNDLTGEITVSVDHQPENIIKYAYGLYFPGGGEMVSKIFTFKSSDVPIGTYFEVNLQYGDNNNQYKFGENSPEKRPELIQFTIS
jgi:hypothetical protein